VRVLIVGCGYLGLPLGEVLARKGHEVFGLRRSSGGEENLRKAGVFPVTGDVTCIGDLKRLPGPFEWVVNTVSSSRGGVEAYREVFLNGTRNLIAWLGDTPLKYVYTSSTSVYGQNDRSEVDESSPTRPDSPTSQVLLETEHLLVEAVRARQFPAVILRVAGIYGPERGHLFLQYLRGEARLHCQGDRIINMVHREDVVGCVQTALEQGRVGEIYNVTDDEPVTDKEFFEWLSVRLGRPMPPSVSLEEISRRKRGLTNKRVCNRKLKSEFGYKYKYPTFRDGYTEEIKRLQMAGLLPEAEGPGTVPIHPLSG
jgi:nucleoside-diphosphate-sugar epimerase